MLQILTCMACGREMFGSGPADQARCPSCTAADAPFAPELARATDVQRAELAAEDRRWSEERKRYSVRNKFGSLEKPSMGSGIGTLIGGGIPAVLFLIRGTNRIASQSEQLYFTILGLVFAVGVLFYFCRTTYLCASYYVTEAEHQMRRHEIQARYPATERKD